MEVFLAMTIILATTFIFQELFKKFNFPVVVGQILVGILLGIPLLKGIIFTSVTTNTIEFLSKLGILFLLFLVGLEIDIKKLKKTAKDSLLIGISAAIVPFIFGFLFLRFLGYDFLSSLIFGGALCVTAEATKAKVLLDLKKLNTKLGAIMIGAGAVDDIFEVFFLSIVTILAFGKGVEELVFFPFEIIIFGVISFFFFYLLKKIVKYTEKKESVVEFFTVIIIFLFLIASLSEILRIGYLIGALVAGFLFQISTRDLKSKKKEKEIVEVTKIITLGFIIPFFFTNVGLNFNYSNVASNALLIIGTIVIGFLGKIIGTLVVKPFSNLNLKQLYLIGWAMNSRGAVELVIALMAKEFNLISSELFSALVVMTMVTTLSFPFILQRQIKRNPRIMD